MCKAKTRIWKQTGLALFFCFILPSAYAANSTPTVGTISPSSGTVNVNQTIIFTTTYSDSNGYQDIVDTYLLINTSISSSQCFLGGYDRTVNKLYLYNDGDGWMGGFWPGTASVLENSYCKLDCAQTTVSGSGNVLTIKWAVVFKPTFTGNKNSYLCVGDTAGAYAEWTQKGSINIQGQAGDTTPPTGSIKINSDAAYSSTTAVTLTLSAQDAGSGMGTGAQMQFSSNNSTWTAAESYAGSKSWTLNSGDGTKTVYVKFKDAAGNWSAAYSDSIILDSTKPVITISSPQDGAVIN